MTTTTQQDLDLAAELTTAVVLQAMSVRRLTRDQAVAFVAEHTGTTVEMVEACLDRTEMIVREGATVKTGNAGGTRPLVWASCSACGWFGTDEGGTSRATAEAEADRHNAKAHR